MEHALELARKGIGLASPNPMVGCILVREGQIVGEGFHEYDKRDHAEIVALKAAGEKGRGATMYVTLEPCSHHGKTPPCADAIVAAGVARVVSAMVDPNPEVSGAGHWRLADAGVVVEVGVGAEEAARAHAGHIRGVRDGRPHVLLKLAVSADGKAGLAGRRPAAITGGPARAHVHGLRATSDALLTGIGTVLADDPLLTCRLPGMAERSPVRVVLDSALRLPPESRLAATAPEVPLWIVAGEGAPTKRAEALQQLGAEVLRGASSAGRLDLAAVLRNLAERGIRRLMVEAGPILAAAFVAADLVDEAVLLRAPTSIGADGLDALEGRPLEALTRSDRLVLTGSETVGADAIERYERR